MAGTAEERLALTRRINRLMFAEYSAVGWLKAVTLPELRQSYLTDEADRALIGRYAHAADDPALDHDLIRLFLREWLVSHIPESVGAWGLDPDGFRRVTRSAAVAVVEQIIATSLERTDAVIGGCLDWLRPDSPGEAAGVPYTQLRVWFAELFEDPATRFYLHPGGGPTVRFDLANPHLAGLAPDLVGMIWIE